MSEFEIGRLNKIRTSHRASYDREAVFGVLAEGMVAHVGFIAGDRPIVVPMIYGRDGDRLYLHGAKAARFSKVTGQGVPVCFTLTLSDGIVVARSAFHCSMNYRSVVIHGHAQLVTDEEEAEKALALITDHLIPGRWAESRPMTRKELRSTAVLSLDIEAASLKLRSGPPVDDEEDYDLPIWAGVVPLQQSAGTPKPDDRVPDGVEIPASVLTPRI